MGIDHNILNHLVRLLPPGAAIIGSFIFLLLVCVIPMHATGRYAFCLWKEDMRCLSDQCNDLVRIVYKVRQAVYESAQVFTQKHWKLSFTLSLPGAECTVALFSLISSISLTTELRPFQSCGLSGQNGAWSIRDTTLQCSISGSIKTSQPEIALVYGS